MNHYRPLRTRLTVLGLVGLMLAALVTAAALLVWSSRQTSLNDSEAQVVRFAAGAEASINRALLSFDVLLASTEELLDLAAVSRAQFNPQGAGQLLRGAARQNLMVRYVVLVAEGREVVASSDQAGLRVADELPPGFFEESLRQSTPSLLLSTPVISSVSSERVLFMARQVRMADGERLLAIAQVPSSMLVSVLMQGVDIPGLEVTLERSDGEMLIGAWGRGEVRRDPSVGPLTDQPEQRSLWGLQARISGVPALVVARPILYQHLWVSASLPQEAALAAWRSERNAIIFVAALFGVILLVAGGLALTYVERMHRARLAIAESKSTLEQALGSMVSGFMLLDAENRVLQWNRRFEEIFPWLKEVVAVGVPFRSLLEASVRHHLPGAPAAQQAEWVEQRMLQQSLPRGTHEQLQPSGRFVQITERATPQGGVMISYHDVTDMRRAAAEIENLAFYDPLTGLPNRRLLLDRLHQAEVAAARSGELGALLFLDLDHFKTLNDTLGHEVGDQLLQQVARRLGACVRAADTVARLGGDEFVVMLRDLSTDSAEAASLARRIGEKILHHLNEPYQLGAQLHHSNCSIGATLFGHVEQSAAELLKQADIAMYQVKAQRGNNLCFFDPEMQVAISRRAQLEADLQAALAGQQFALHYQPQFTRQGRLVGAEALLRWLHPERGLVSPAQFIAVAEDSELIVPIGLWVLQTACEQLAAWQADPLFKDLHLAVNVSARQFRQADFVPKVVQVLQQTGIRPHLLELELTESLVLDNVDDSVAKMHLLRTKGVRFSVDDFGTGYSSLAYLTRLPLHQLKIDQSFVRNLGVRHTDDVIVQTIIGMARNLELEVIAEGVETETQREFLVRHGCGLYQGFLLGRPMPVEALQALVRERSALPAAPDDANG